MAAAFELPVKVRWRDVDALGHVNHAVFLTYLLDRGRASSACLLRDAAGVYTGSRNDLCPVTCGVCSRRLASVWTDSALDRALVAVAHLAQESHPGARAAMASARDEWLAQIREEVGSPAIAHAILLIGDGLYFDAALTGGSLSTQVAQVAVDELLPVIDHLLELGRR